MEGFWSLVKFALFAAVALTIITNVIHYRRAKRSNPSGSFWDHMEEATQQIKDAGLTITKDDVKTSIQNWVEREDQRIEAQKEYAELKLGMKGFISHGSLDDTKVLYERDGKFYEYNAETNKMRAL